jgi:hypothetical protein
MKIWLVQICCLDPADDYVVEVSAKTASEAGDDALVNLGNDKALGVIRPKYEKKKQKKEK